MTPGHQNHWMQKANFHPHSNWDHQYNDSSDLKTIPGNFKPHCHDEKLGNWGITKKIKKISSQIISIVT